MKEEEHENFATEEAAASSSAEAKRAAEQAQALGARLLELEEEKLASLPLSDAVREALAEGRRVAGRQARRRHLQFLGKLMRNLDLAAVRQALAHIELADTRAARRGEELQRWLARLLEQGADGGDGALAELLRRYPLADRQRLRHLLRRARKPDATERNRRHLSTALLELLQEGSD